MRQANMSFANAAQNVQLAWPRIARKYWTYGLVGLFILFIMNLSPSENDTGRRVKAAYSAFRSPERLELVTPPDSMRPEPQVALSSPEDIKLSGESTTAAKAQTGKGANNYTATVVSGRLSAQEKAVSWIHDLHNITSKAIYIVDDPSADYHLEKNHGREAMVYLTYIVDHYDKLNDITFFFHTQDIAWHNNLLMNESSAASINMMNRSFVMEQGYVNTRCDHWPGCPSWVVFNPTKAEHALDPHRLSDMFNKDLFGRLFPNETEYPRYFAQTCCSQFAASRDAIRNVPLEEWKRLRQWIQDDWLDQYTGRAMEMMWQYIFKRKGVSCPSMTSCYCRQYGICLDHGPDRDEEGVELLRRWNEMRTRSEEIQWQIWFRSDQLHADKTKVWNYNERDDPEYARIEDERAEVRKETRKLKDAVMKHFNVPASEVGW